MALTYESIIASAPFGFLVGNNKRLFHVHAAAITHHSKRLGDVINDHISEAKEVCDSLEYVEESTFIRFSQFAYTDDYIAADPEILLDSSTIAVTASELTPPIDPDGFLAAAAEEPPIEHPNDQAEAQPWNGQKKYRESPELASSWGQPSKPEDNLYAEESASSSRKEKLWKLFESKAYVGPKPLLHPRKNRKSCEAYEDVFLCHARLYVFAEKWDIARLRMLSLKKLHVTLSVFTPYKERAGDIVALMRYSYANTERSDDPLRSLVIHYAACVVEKLVPSSKFKALLEEPGELASDLVVKMIDRLD